MRIAKKRDSQNAFFFSKLLDERLLFFESATCVRPDISINVALIRRCITAVDLKVKLIRFLASCNDSGLFLKCGFRARPNFLLKCLLKFGGDKTPF